MTVVSAILLAILGAASALLIACVLWLALQGDVEL